MADAVKYYPRSGHWERRDPRHVGMDPDLLQQAIELHQAGETERYPKGAMRNGLLGHLLREPHNEIIGPIKERGGINGLVIRNGYIVAEWGDTRRVDMTFSITKSYLATTAGLAYDRGLIRSLTDKVSLYIQDGGFDSEHNAGITWHQLLNQTSGWEGTLWGKPDWADRPTEPLGEGGERPRSSPGTYWQYNDVRVNRLALSLLHVWRRPLPFVLRKYVMDPIGASPTWQWHGYENSWVTIDGLHMQSVSGGGHWGGGMWISSRDQARFGYLILRNGNWKGKQILSEDWLERCKTPVAGLPPAAGPEGTSGGREATDPMPAEEQFNYGYMNFFLNTYRRLLPRAPESSHFHSGAGCNFLYVDPVHDLVVVVRWLERDHLDDFLGLIVRSIAA